MLGKSLVIGCLLFQSSAFAYIARKVQTGGDGNSSACYGYGVILKETKMVYQDESDQTKDDRIVLEGTEVIVCDLDGNHFGIVIPVEGVSCGIIDANPDREDYNGPCASGWVPTELVGGPKRDTPVATIK